MKFLNKKIIEVPFNEECLDVNKGICISIEGLDASGKCSNVELLTDVLEKMGFDVVVYHFPEYESTVGKVIARYLQGDFGNINQVPKELVCTAYAADRAKHAEDINMYLENGAIVLCDRYTYSNMFSVAKLPKEQWDEFLGWVEDLEFNCLGVVKPDYNIYLHVDPEISIKRIEERGKRDYQEGKEDIHEANKDLLRNASEAYLYFADKKDNWIVIDEMENKEQLPLEVVFSKLFVQVSNVLKEKGLLSCQP